MKYNVGSCNSELSSLTEASIPKLNVRLKNKLKNLSPPFIKIIFRETRTLLLRLKDVIFRKLGASKSNSFNNDKILSGISNSPSHAKTALNLHPGEWIEVRSYDEILLTLDENRKHKGLTFNPDMEKFCGGRYKVFKNLNYVRLEATGENREIKTPTVLLESVYCDGKDWGGCDRTCFHFWREVWLKRINEK